MPDNLFRNAHLILTTLENSRPLNSRDLRTKSGVTNHNDFVMATSVLMQFNRIDIGESKEWFVVEKEVVNHG